MFIVILDEEIPKEKAVLDDVVRQNENLAYLIREGLGFPANVRVEAFLASEEVRGDSA